MLLQQPVVAAGETGLSGEGRMAGGIAQVGVDGGVGVVFPVTETIGGAEDRREIVGDFEFRVGHARVEQSAGAEDVGGGAEFVLRGVSAGGAGGKRAARDVAERLAVAVLIVGADPKREFAGAVAGGHGGLERAIGVFGAVQFEALPCGRLGEGGLEFFGEARGDFHHGADGVAGVGGGKRAIH